MGGIEEKMIRLDQHIGDQLQKTGDFRADAINGAKLFGGCVQHLRQRPETVQKSVSHRIDVLPRNGVKKEQFQYLVVREAVQTICEKAAAHSAAMPGVEMLLSLHSAHRLLDCPARDRRK